MRAFDHEPRILVRPGAHALEARGELGFDRVRERRVVAGSVLELAQAIVGAAVDLDHVEPLLEQRDRRQEVLPLQAVRIEVVRPVVRGHHEDHAALEERA